MLLPTSPPQFPIWRRTPHAVIVSNQNVKLVVDARTGLYDIIWPNGDALRNTHAEARLRDGTLLTTTSKTRRTITVEKVADLLGHGIKLTERLVTNSSTELRVEFWVYDDAPEVIVRTGITGNTRTVSTNSISPIVSNTTLHFKRRGPLQSLYVPYDNDQYSRYQSDSWSQGNSHELGAVYDDQEQKGIVVGSIDHDTWKTGVRFRKDAQGNVIEARVTAGVVDKQTHDSEAHGFITEPIVQSPRIILGDYRNWKTGLERYW